MLYTTFPQSPSVLLLPEYEVKASIDGQASNCPYNFYTAMKVFVLAAIDIVDRKINQVYQVCTVSMLSNRNIPFVQPLDVGSGKILIVASVKMVHCLHNLKKVKNC